MGQWMVFNRKRVIAGIMGLLLLVALLFSAFYIAAEADHHCTGEDCPICACIRQSENTLRSLGKALAVRDSAVLPACTILILTAVFVAVIQKKTLVSKKVRLNN